MSAETIIAIVTAGIALVTSVASFTYNFIQNKKDRVQKVILDNRIKYMYAMREGYSSLIGLANAGAINSLKNGDEVKKIYFEKLFSGYGQIKSYIKPFYSIDIELLTALDKLYSYILAMINGEENDDQKLEAYREDFSKKYLIYDWAYWKYIQRQKEGNYTNSDDAFDKVYEDFLEELKDRKVI